MIPDDEALVSYRLTADQVLPEAGATLVPATTPNGPIAYTGSSLGLGDVEDQTIAVNDRRDGCLLRRPGPASCP